MATAVRRFTYDDLETTPEAQEGDRHELLGGELVVTSFRTPVHQGISVNITIALGRYVRDNGLGRVLCAPVNVRFTPDNVLVPDLLFVVRDRMHGIGPYTVDVAPDLVVEIISTDTRHRDLHIKKATYARFGVQEYWLIDPGDKTATVCSLSGYDYRVVEQDGDGTIRSRVLPGLDLALVDVFFDP